MSDPVLRILHALAHVLLTSSYEVVITILIFHEKDEAWRSKIIMCRSQTPEFLLLTTTILQFFPVL